MPRPSTLVDMGAGSVYAAGALAVVLVARASRRLFARRPIAAGAATATATRWRHTLTAVREGEADVPGVMSRACNMPQKQPGQGAWWDPGDPSEGWENQGETPKEKRPVKKKAKPLNYAVWIARKGEVPGILESWAKASDTEEKQKLYEAVAKANLQDLIIWALADPSVLEGGGGLYMLPPRNPQALIFLEAVDGQINNIHHIAVSPTEITSGVQAAVLGWMDSLKPKRCVIKRPQEMTLFGIELTSGTSGAKVSKGL